MPRKSKRNMPIKDGIQFDSNEELEVYSAILDGTIVKLTSIDELKGAKMINPRVEPVELAEGFKAGEKTFRKRVYTYDFDIKLGRDNVALEVKSSWTEQQPDYRLRRFLFLLLKRDKYKFAELIKIRKGVWKFIKYY